MTCFGKDVVCIAYIYYRKVGFYRGGQGTVYTQSPRRLIWISKINQYYGAPASKSSWKIFLISIRAASLPRQIASWNTLQAR